MTREEAKEFLTFISHTLGNMSIEYLTEKDGEKMREAIKTLEQEPCEDTISRKDTLKAMIEQLGIRNEDYLIPAEATLYKVVKNMPPVTPQPNKEDIHREREQAYMCGYEDASRKYRQEPKTGHWRAVYQGDEIINYRCSECEFGDTFGKRPYGMYYCPNCGARMERSDKECR